MNRRNFLQLAALAIAGQAAERVFPFRVYSIPKKIVSAQLPLYTGNLCSPSTRVLNAGQFLPQWPHEETLNGILLHFKRLDTIARNNFRLKQFRRTGLAY